MSVRLRDVVMGKLDTLRYEPIEKRIRAELGERTVVDSTRALVVWEPKRVVPNYAVPVEDVASELVAAPGGELIDPETTPAMGASQLGNWTVYDPNVPFQVHTTDGEALTVRAPEGDREAAVFRLSDAELAGYLLLDFDAFDAWYEEDERNVAHPRDPFHRIDILHSSRHVKVELRGEVLAESTMPYLLFEPPLPVRYYLPADDVRMELFEPSDSRTFCAYKGEASYWSVAGEKDLAWRYRQPLRDAREITDRIAFFNERVDLLVDGTRHDRPVTPWTPRE